MQKFLHQNDDWQIVKQHTKKLFGPDHLSLSPKDVIVLVRVRNGAEYLDSFVNYYLQLGVRHLFFLDNGSEDDTIALAQQYQQVTVLQTTLPYKKYKVAFFQFLLREYGMNCWSLVVDIDEFFDYPFSELVSLPNLIDYLEDHKYEAVVGQMLDLFPIPLSLDDDSPERFPDFLRDHIHYDLSDISKHQLGQVIQKNDWSNYNISIHKGGIRKKWFGLDKILLSKFPLVRYSPDWYWESIHRLYPCRVADFSVVLYHYKFRSDFKLFVQKAVTEENYNRDSAAYKKILASLQSEKNFDTGEDTIQQLSDTYSLVAQDFIETSGAYLKYIAQLLDQKIEFNNNKFTSTTAERKQMQLNQNKLISLLIQKIDTTNLALSEAKRFHHEEIHKEIDLIKNTRSWKLGNAIIKPIKKIISWLPFWRN